LRVLLFRPFSAGLPAQPRTCVLSRTASNALPATRTCFIPTPPSPLPQPPIYNNVMCNRRSCIHFSLHCLIDPFALYHVPWCAWHASVPITHSAPLLVVDLATTRASLLDSVSFSLLFPLSCARPAAPCLRPLSPSSLSRAPRVPRASIRTCVTLSHVPSFAPMRRMPKLHHNRRPRPLARGAALNCPPSTINTSHGGEPPPQGI